MCVRVRPAAVSYEVCERVFGLVPFYGMQRDGSRFLHVLPEQHLAVRPVQVGHLNAGCPRVRPVQLVMDPVDGQSACRRNKCLFACWGKKVLAMQHALPAGTAYLRG